MKARKIILGVVVSIVAIIALVIGTKVISYKATHRVSERIINYMEENNIEDSTEIRLADFTDFEWDTVILYRWPITNYEIEKWTGVKHRKDTDLYCGMILADGDEVVYEEVYNTICAAANETGPVRFTTAINGANLKVWKKEDAIFNVNVWKSKGKNVYEMIPIPSMPHYTW